MSAGAVFQRALRMLRDLEVEPVAEADVCAVLEANRQGPLQLFYDAACEAGHPRETVRTRSAAAFLCYAAGQLADDLADGECGYLQTPYRTGPSAQFILQNLFYEAMISSGVSLQVVSEVARTLSRGAGPQSVEVRTKRWTEPLSKKVAFGIAGLQFAAYLKLLWDGVPLARFACDVGWRLGVVAQIATDAKTGDPRMKTLDPADRRRLVAWSMRCAEELRRHDLAFVEPVLRWAEPLLEATE